MKDTLNPTEIESHWREHWQSSQAAQKKNSGSPYCIMLPPPNVTGRLHMGHAFQQTIMDILIRSQHMKGHNTHWQVGTDHAGIATQMVVERQLQRQDLSRHDLGRPAFLEKVWEWKAESGQHITDQMRRLGLHVDWSCQRFTMDEHLSQATREAFIRLHKQGLIYRGQRLVNWDPVLKTAVSDLEVESITKSGHLWHIRYPIEGETDQYLTVATTRPETMLADVAVAVHPEDERYKQLVGKRLHLPLTDRSIPVIADDAVDPEFGSGCVKITPAHDFNDYAMGQRHDLPLINMLTPDCTLNEAVPEAYRGMGVKEARKAVVADLTAGEFLVATTPHSLNVPTGDRSGAVLEPLLTKQWFVKMDGLAKAGLEAVDKGDVQFVPGNWRKTYDLWLENIQDWCISRQLWWGHQIPVWYDNEGNHYVGHDEASVRKEHALANDIELTQDEDVLDTWFSSSLWPFATLGWPEQTPNFEQYFPTQTLVTGFDIIFFWVARMIMMSLALTGKAPFKDVYITGLIRDAQGNKMSKTKGNVLDPIDLIDGISLDDLVEKRVNSVINPKQAKAIEKSTRQQFPDGIPAFGTDALRLTFCALATTGRDINFDLARAEGYRHFCNKLWNATRFVHMQLGTQSSEAPNPAHQSVADQWIMHRLQETVKRCDEALAQYRFDWLQQALYEFTWHDFCDWYLELSKITLNSDDSSDDQKTATRATLARVLTDLIARLHPIMPYITETLWQSMRPLYAPIANIESVIDMSMPTHDTDLLNGSANTAMAAVQELVSGVRRLRSESDLAPSLSIPVRLYCQDNDKEAMLKEYLDLWAPLVKLSQVDWLTETDSEKGCASAHLDGISVTVPLKGLIDTDKALARIDKQIKKMTEQRDKAKKKCDNPRYIENAPADVVQKERDLLAQCEQALSELALQREAVEALK